MDFEKLHAEGRSPLECAALAEAAGMSRIEAYKAVFTHWGPEPFSADELMQHVSGYPSRAAAAAATVGLAAIVLEYASATADDVAAFDRATGISRKVDALSRAGRPDDALAFYDRLDPRRLWLAPIAEGEARRLVLEMRATSSSLSSVVVDDVEAHPWGWVFSPWSGDGYGQGPTPPGAGVRPILFDRFTALAIGLHRVEPTAVHVRLYAETGWPFPLP